MKFVKINDNLKINIEQIYSLEYRNNQKDINIWTDNYNKYLNKFTKDPIELPIDDKRIFKPSFGYNSNEDDIRLYADALNNHIISIIGSKPIYEEKFSILLITGLKINVSKDIYEKIDNYIEKYIIK